jgi:enterochelin esterase family protein
VPEITLHIEDPADAYASVRLCSDLELPPARREFAREDGRWVLRLGDLPLQRLEYLIEVEHVEGGYETIPDPVNPGRVSGVFGDKSELRLGGYADPWWLRTDRVPGEAAALSVPSRALKADVKIGIWSPEGHEGPLPLLVANDGHEYEDLSKLTTYAAALIGTQELKPFRVALIAPGERNEWYSASAAYARALATEILPAVRREVAVDRHVVGMGASLGGLAMLHAHRRYPSTFAGLFLQSSSFFLPRFDAHESGFPRWQRIIRFVRGTLATERADDSIPIAITCGTCEENRHNNRLVADRLAAQGNDVSFHLIGDTHNYTAWRDAFDPHLTDLLVRAWWSER